MPFWYNNLYRCVMGKKVSKSNIFAGIAAIILFFAFTLPMVVFYNVPNKIQNNRIEDIPAFVYPLWNLYETGRYLSPYTPKGAERDLKKMIELKGEVGMMSTPVWFVSLEAPNYPKAAFPDGIPVYFHLDGYSGDVHEMNTINHFIGMYPMEAGAQLERKISPFLMLLVSVLMVIFLVYKGKFSPLLMAVPALIPAGFFAVYSGWLYWYGHNLQEWGMFKVKPFMPTALGDGKVAQFTTHSYPTIGFYLLLIVAVLSILAILARIKENKEHNK